ncbi:MAG: hypothetical protein JKY15_01885 [Deltaproteobacteria bacterium]|nr:hypothetical protein [Deltaproteobacteria bacterium]
MTLTKKWLLEEIETEPNPGIKLALERVFQKYTEAPTRGKENPQTTLKEFDRDATYSKVVHFYIDEKKYTKEQAHEIAVRIVTRETERRNLK